MHDTLHGLLKDTTLLAALASWAALAALLVGIGRFRLTGTTDRALAFLVTAAATRLALTHVRTRWQIAAFVIVASLAAAADAVRTGRGAAAVRWAASLGGILVGSIVTREFVHHVVERWR